MISCPECGEPLDSDKLLFKMDYSVIECANCGSRWNLKVRRNKFYRVFGAIFGCLSFILLSAIMAIWGLLWLGVIAFFVILGVGFLIMRNFVEKFIEIVKY